MKATQLALAVAAIGFAGGLYADEASQHKTEKIEVTGSSIKRIAKEGAVPVTTISKEDIAKTGATSVTDLIQNLPSMQGYIASSQSVNSGGAGITSAALHALQSKYTLVLLNGRRMAAAYTGANNGSAVNLESIPLASIERIEVLTDGASAIYGADAVAGVVNFILKKNYQGLEVSATTNQPQKSGGENSSGNLVAGFGSMDTDGFNIQLSYSHDDQKKLLASQRDFTKQGGVFQFENNGKKYWYTQWSSNAVPANLLITFDNDIDNFQSFYNPNRLETGDCPAPGIKQGTRCRYNYAAVVDNQPESKRDSFFLTGRAKLGGSFTGFGELAYTDFTMRAAYAPPAQPLGVIDTSPGGASPYSILDNATLDRAARAAFIDMEVPGNYSHDRITQAQVWTRVADAGRRTDDYKTKSFHGVAGVEGNWLGWDVSASFTHSEAKFTDEAVSGYVDSAKFKEIIRSGKYDPFHSAQGSAVDALAPAVLRGKLNEAKSTLDVLTLKASGEAFQMPEGAAMFGGGVDIVRQGYTGSPSVIYQGGTNYRTRLPDGTSLANTAIGGSAGQLPFDTTRDVWGTYGELLLPVHRTLELSTALRYDHYSAAKNAKGFDETRDAAGNITSLTEHNGSTTEGNSFSRATFKISGRWTPNNSTLIRASYGTGFRAPELQDITNPTAFLGSTNGTYSCPFPGTLGCQGEAQYDLLQQGNKATGANGLKPERSTQWSMGGRFEPSKSVSLGLDLWNVEIKDQIQPLNEATAFANAGAYKKFFTVINDPTGGFKSWAFSQQPINLSRAEYQGIDWDHTFRTPFFGTKLSAQWTGTYMLKARYTDGATGQWKSSLGRYGDDNNVVSRVVTTLSLTDVWGAFTNTFALHYKSGYHDQEFKADDAVIRAITATGGFGGALAFGAACSADDAKTKGCDPTGRDVASYSTLDWQTRYTGFKNLTLTGGIKNLSDRKPPLSLQNAGAGNSSGYDGRYADALGRVYYLTVGYKFF
ncbi:TonB-dependent receptor domain-containing protein [Chitinimonas sp.]|uniref:TonB-dependent receptor domain-containing protein n=1 Tax=Chitinimonas sp. TaxID=1934313 RepID=UPI0035AFFDAC